MDVFLYNCPVIVGSASPRRRWASPRQTRGLLQTLFSYRHYFPTVLNIVQVGSCGGTPRAKGTLYGFARLWVSVNGTQRCGIRLHDIHMISAG